jgi:hypothetical protein
MLSIERFITNDINNNNFFPTCITEEHILQKLPRVSYKTVPQTDTNTETGGCMYGEGLLMMSA